MDCCNLNMNLIAAIGALTFYIYLYVYDYMQKTQIKNNEFEVSSEEQQEQQESIISQPILQTENSDYDKTNDTSTIPYRHEFWSSPRPVNFVKTLVKSDPYFKPEYKRLSHRTAVYTLASRANLSTQEFLKTNPILYSYNYMNGMNALYLLKDDIELLENTLRQQVKKDYERLENGKISCPRS